MDLSIGGLWNAMGLLAKGVVIIMLVMSLLSIWVFIDRLMLFISAKNQSKIFTGKAAGLIRQNKLDDVVRLAEANKNSHIAFVCKATILEFRAAQDGASYDVIEAAKHAAERATIQKATQMKSNLNLLATIGATAPFVGLFGTVVGIINAFEGIGKAGAGGIGAVAGGIAEALVTTAIGLFVAIPAVWFFNYFVNKADLFSIEMSNTSSELIDQFQKLSAEQE